MTERDGEGFLGRWSRLKRQARSSDSDAVPAPQSLPPRSLAPRSLAPLRPEEVGEIGGQATPGSLETRVTASVDDALIQQPRGDDPERMLTEADFADVDFASLDAASDYKRFMGSNVPAAIRDRALAKLWTSNPLFAGLDPIHDYHGDYTDAAVAVTDGIKTAYRVGRGFLSDEEVAAWEKLGKPEARTAEVAPAGVGANGDAGREVAAIEAREEVARADAPSRLAADEPAPQPQDETHAAPAAGKNPGQGNPGDRSDGTA